MYPKFLLLLFFAGLCLLGFTEDSVTVKDSTTVKDSVILIQTDSIATDQSKRVYRLNLKDNISPKTWRYTQAAFKEAAASNADLILIHMNTYGGLVVSADSIRTSILNSKIPVVVFIDNNAASAGALISIACDKIYMRKGANIGAATVVNQEGKEMPDKYQSYMRATMRSTAEAQGRDTIIENGDTTLQWKRDPNIAQAMVDPTIHIAGLIDSTKVLTFTANEAVEYGFCDGIAENISEVLHAEGIENHTIQAFEPSFLDRMIGIFSSPTLQGILIMFIIGGLYFELQSPGIGFPLIIAILAAVVYFAPLYLEGLAQYWEIILFVAGVILIIVEIFVIPGFGVAGVSGIALMISGLALSMIHRFELQPIEGSFNIAPLVKAFALVSISTFIAFFLSIWISKKVFAGNALGHLALNDSQKKEEGYISHDPKQKSLHGKSGIALTDLRPSGKVEVEDDIYDGIAKNAYIDKGSAIRVVRDESGQVYVEILSDSQNL